MTVSVSVAVALVQFWLSNNRTHYSCCSTNQTFKTLLTLLKSPWCNHGCWLFENDNNTRLTANFQHNLSKPVSPFQILSQLRMMEVVVTAEAIRCTKLQSNCHLRKTNARLFTDRMPFLSSNQQYQSTERKSITFRRLAHPKLTCEGSGFPTLSLTIKGSWLSWERVAKPLISLLTPVPNTG